MRQFIREQLLQGKLPQWYPYEGLGVPFIGQIITATFHPQTWLFLPFAAPLALKLNILAANLLGGTGTYRFARTFNVSRNAALIGAASLAFGGYALSMSDNLPYLMGLATLPWVGWAARRIIAHQQPRDAAVLGLTWALILLAGDAQMFAVTPLLLLAVLFSEPLTRRTVILMAFGGGIALLVAGIEWVPATAVYAESARFAGQTTVDLGSFWALHPLRLMEFITPGFLPASDRSQICSNLLGSPFVWSASLFAGGLTLWLAVAGGARRARAAIALSALTLGAIWLALGSRGGLHTLLVQVAPVLGRFRFPEKYLALFWVGVATLAAFGWDVVVAQPRRFSLVAVVAGILCAVLAVVMGSGLGVGFLWHLQGHALNPIEVGSRVASAWGSGLLTTSVLLLVAAGALRTPRLTGLIPLLLVVELWNGNARFFPLVAPKLLDPESNPFADAVRAESSRGLAPPRVLNNASPSPINSDAPEASAAWVATSMALLRPDSAGLAHVAVMGHSALPAFGGRARLLFGPQGARDERFSGLFNGCDRTVALNSPMQLDEQLVAQETELGVAVVKQPCRPRAYFAQMLAVNSSDLAFKEVDGGLRAGVSVWEDGPELPASEGRVHWNDWQPGRMGLEVDAAGDTGLVISEAFATGWQAEIDGGPTPLYPTNVVALGMVVPRGHHFIKLWYETPRLRIGAGCTALGLALVIGLFWRGRALRCDLRPT
jgi:hypothetical protein